VRATRVATAGAVAAVATLAPVLLLSSPSQAEPQRLKVSTSATGPWSDHLATALFDGAGAFVPQDSVTDTFYVKNDSHQPARATLTVLDRAAGNDFERGLAFTASIGGVTSDAPVVVDTTTSCRAYVSGPRIPPGGVQEVGVTLEFGDVTGKVAMGQQAGLAFVVTLSQVTPAGDIDICGAEEDAGPPAECTDPSRVVVAMAGGGDCTQVKGEQELDPAGDLPDTGASAGAGGLAGLGLACLAGGVLLLVRRRLETG
jgi:LPXTG-motif cell wall-anchored protein